MKYLSLIMMIGCSVIKDQGTSSCEQTDAIGYRTVEQDGTTRGYILHLPSGYDASLSYPLVIAYHGNGGCASDFQNDESQLNETADLNNFILAYPQGIARAKGETEWDPGDDGTPNITTNDHAFTDLIISDIQASHNIISEQIYAVGYSNGGMMAYGLACSRGNNIAAIGIMSGIMLEGSCNQTDYTSVIHFHGTSDFALPYEGNSDFQSVAEVISFWVTHNNIDGAPSSSDLGGISRDIYSEGSEGTSVVLYTIQDGEHIWFSDNIDGTAPNQLLWNFLSQYTLTGTVGSD